MNDQSRTPDRRSAAIAVILIAVGAIFLLGELFNFRVGSGFWPLFILVPGLALLYTAFSGERASAGPAAGGAILTTLGLIFFFQNSTDNWESWAYVWALLPFSVGLSQIAVGTRNDDEGLVATGRNTIRIFGIIFIAGVAFFELLIFDRPGFGGYLLPIALIAIGAFLLWLNYRRNGSLPFADMFPSMDGGQRPQTPPGSSGGSGQASAGAAERPTTSAAPPPSSATPPSGSQAHFPEDELPHEPPADDAPFPADEQSPASAADEAAAQPAEAEKPKPKPRRRTSGTRTRKPTATDNGSNGD